MRNEAARAVLVQIRDMRADPPTAAGMLEAALPASNPARMDFMLVLADYLCSALEGAAVDPEHL